MRHPDFGGHTNSSGFGMISVIIAAAIGTIVSLALAGVFSNMQKSQNNVKFRGDADNLAQDIRTLFSSEQACIRTFGGLFARPNASYQINDLKDPSNKAQYVTGKIYGDHSVLIKSMKLEAYDPGMKTMNLDLYLQSSKQSLGAQTVTRQIRLGLKTSPTGDIISCETLSKMTDGIWQRTLSDPNNIYFSSTAGSGKVGIGTTNPQAQLDVNGGIHPGSAKTGTSCIGQAEGTMAYDYSAHLPVYCSQSGKWKGSSGISSVTVKSCGDRARNGIASCTVTCPDDTYRVGCSASSGTATPANYSLHDAILPNGCSCRFATTYSSGSPNSGGHTDSSGTCYAYCAQ